MSGFSPSTTASMRVSTNMPTASAAVCAPRRPPARRRSMVVALRTDEQGLFCDWEKANDPDFKIFYSSGQNFQSRFALTAAMMKKAGKDVAGEHRRPLHDEAGGQGHVQSGTAARRLGVDAGRQRHDEGDVREVGRSGRRHRPSARTPHPTAPASIAPIRSADLPASRRRYRRGRPPSPHKGEGGASHHRRC